MKSVKLLSLVFCLLILSAGLVAAPVSSAPSPEEMIGKLKGMLLDVNGARVVKAVVKVEGGKVKRRMKSGLEGEFEFELPPGSYRITVAAEGFRRYASSRLEVRSGETKAVTISLRVAEPPGLVPAS
jgi:hypothetical protein